jgi:predicted transposase YbfD/YdcC
MGNQPKDTAVLIDKFDMMDIPGYYWLLCLLKPAEPKSLNECFIKWAQSLCEPLEGHTLSFDGKTIRSTGRMEKDNSPMHIVSAQIPGLGLGLTLAQQTVADKSNEIPAMRDLLTLLKVEGCIITADALHCQKETAKAIVKKKADYLLSVKDNQAELKEEIKDYIQNNELCISMVSEQTAEKNRGRIERRTAYTTNDIKKSTGQNYPVSVPSTPK